jgi:hypothetical protein
MMESTSYHLVREKIIQLTVDLDDKTKLCASLQRKIAAVRESLSHVESNATEEFDAIMKNEALAFADEFKEKNAKLNDLVERKKALLANCEEMLE